MVAITVVHPREAEDERGITPVEQRKAGAYDAIVIAVDHLGFAELGVQGRRAFGRDPHGCATCKHLLPRDAADLRL